MVISMAVLIIPILAIVWFFQTAPEEAAEELDITPVLQQAENESPYPVLRPANLPEDWVPVRVAWAADGQRWINGEPAVGNSWQLGYLAPNDIYVGIQQRDRNAAAFITSITREGLAQDESFTVDGREWEHFISADSRTQSLVWRDGDVVAAVTADDEVELLLAFVGALSEG